MTNKRNETTNLSFYTFIMSELKKKKKELPYPLGVGVRKQKRRMIERFKILHQRKHMNSQEAY